MGTKDFYTLVTAIRPRYLTLRDYAFRHGLYSKAEQIQGKYILDKKDSL